MYGEENFGDSIIHIVLTFLLLSDSFDVLFFLPLVIPFIEFYNCSTLFSIIQ